MRQTKNTLSLLPSGNIKDVYRWISKWQYRRRALTRHGVHSPFVFEFVEQLLHGHCRQEGPALTLPFVFPEKKFTRLVSGIAQYYDCSNVAVWGGPVQELPGQGKKGFATLLLSAPGSLPPALPAMSGTILVVSDIRKDKNSEQRWESLIKNSTVTLSVDLFDIGLLFFEEDFRVKQHFTLRF